jgi:hypothetical protein
VALEDLPVAILSSAPLDALRERAGSADCHIEKPTDLDGFMAVGRLLWGCWDSRRRVEPH